MALFKTTEDIQPFYPARLSVDFADVKPFIESAEHEYMNDLVLGQDLYEDLVTEYEASIDTGAPTPMSGEMEDLLPYVRKALLPLALYQCGTTLSVQLTSGGLVVARGEKFDVASMGRVQEFKAEQLRAGHRALDRLIDFLLENAGDYPNWTGAATNDLAKGLVKHTREFNQHVSTINNSGYLFMRLRPIIREVEEGPIKATLCSEELYDQLRAESSDNDTWTGENEELMKLVRPAVCYLTMDRAITELSLVLDEHGIWTFEAAAGNSGERVGGPRSASDMRLASLKLHYGTQASNALQALKDKCQELAEAGDLDLYADSDCYDDPDDTSDDPEERDPEDMVGGFL